MDYSTAQTRAGEYAIDLPSETVARLGDFVNSAIRYAEVRHNFRYMEATAEFTTTALTRLLGSRPASWKEMRTAPYLQHFDGTRTEILFASSPNEMSRWYGTSTTYDIGEPEQILEVETRTAGEIVGTLEVYPLPDELSDYADDDYRIVVPYWSFSTALSNGADTAPPINNPDFDDFGPYYAAALACQMNEDDQRAAKYFKLADLALTQAIKRDKASRIPDRATLTPRRTVFGRSITPRNGTIRRWR